MIFQKRNDYWEIIGRAAAPSLRLLSCDLEGINRKIFTDLRFVKCYPCKWHDFINQFILII